MTNIAYLHTCTIGIVNLLMTVIFLMHGDLLKLMGDVVRGARISIPICVYSI